MSEKNLIEHGVYSKNDLSDLTKLGRIQALKNFKDSHISVASIDITVEDEIYEVEGFFKPLVNKKESIRDILKLIDKKKLNLGDVMYPGKIYVAKASIDLDFPPGLFMYINPKSTSGRNFLLVRTIADEIGIFDGVDAREMGYTGELWLVFEPLVYPIILTQEEAYTQMRVSNQDTRMNNESLKQFLISNNIIFDRQDNIPYKQGEIFRFINQASILNTLYAPANKFVGYLVKENITVPVDLTKRDLNPDLYFEKIFAKEFEKNNPIGYIELKQNRKYLLSTNELLKIPNHICGELKNIDPKLGLFFSHFAGFFDPGFFGTGTLEVTPMHNLILRHQEPIARLELEYLRNETVSYAEVQNNYAGQIETKLPKQFKKFEN